MDEVTAAPAFDLSTLRAKLEEAAPLRAKLVLHRGWHRLSESDGSRPLENTRQAYLDAAWSGAAFAECDVWSTRDGKMVLCHDRSFQVLAKEPQSMLASTPIAQLESTDLRNLELKDGSMPVMLDTVLQDLAGTQTRLAIELKSSGPAAPLAAFLNGAVAPLRAAVGFVMSFSLDALELFHSSGAPEGTQLVWLTDNPSTTYDPAVKNEGERTFDYTAESLTDFLGRQGLTERVRRLRCGLYIQYNPLLTASHLQMIRADLRALLELPASAAAEDAAAHRSFVGLWSDASLDPGMDTLAGLLQYAASLDAVNSDMPEHFWWTV